MSTLLAIYLRIFWGLLLCFLFGGLVWCMCRLLADLLLLLFLFVFLTQLECFGIWIFLHNLLEDSRMDPSCMSWLSEFLCIFKIVCGLLWMEYLLHLGNPCHLGLCLLSLCILNVFEIFWSLLLTCLDLNRYLRRRLHLTSLDLLIYFLLRFHLLLKSTYFPSSMLNHFLLVIFSKLD